MNLGEIARTTATRLAGGSPGGGAASIHATVPKMDMFVRFETWNVRTKAFEPVGNMKVDLMDDDPHFDDEIDTQVTNAKGFIHFSITEAELKDKSGEDKPDLYFKARPDGLVVGGISLPEKWSTKYWKDKNGKPGYFPNTPFAGGTSLGKGTEADPLVYRIGLDYHLKFQFMDPKEKKLRRAPKGLGAGLLFGDRTRTDRNGELHGVSFDDEARETIGFYVAFDIEDPDINLQLANVRLQAWGDPRIPWGTGEDDADQKVFKTNGSTSVGTQDKPFEITASVKNRDVALFFLTMLYEHACFFFHITGGSWTGIENLEIFDTATFGTAYSWPVGSVNIPESSWSERETLIHELSHQVMWKEANFASREIARLAGSPDGLNLRHSEFDVSNETTALLEGWAEVFEGLFEPGALKLKHDSKVDLGGGELVPLGPNPPGQGLMVEGAFAQGILSIFKSFVVPKSSSAVIPRSENGDVTKTAPWIKDPEVQKRFKSAIWTPLHMLPESVRRSSDFIYGIEKSNPVDWPDMTIQLNQFNIVSVPQPVLTSVDPGNGGASGGQTITLQGSNFTSDTKVIIGGKAVTELVATPSKLRCKTPPGSAGFVDVVVSTPGGLATLSHSYEYTQPTISSISPTSGPVDGGQLLTISGKYFDPSKVDVKIGGSHVAKFVSVPGDMDSTGSNTATLNCYTPPGPAGKVDVVITNPDGSGTLPGAYEYVDSSPSSPP